MRLIAAPLGLLLALVIAVLAVPQVVTMEATLRPLTSGGLQSIVDSFDLLLLVVVAVIGLTTRDDHYWPGFNVDKKNRGKRVLSLLGGWSSRGTGKRFRYRGCRRGRLIPHSRPYLYILKYRSAYLITTRSG